MKENISIKNMDKSFDDLLILQDFDLEIDYGKITGLLGPSGSGKTTILNIIAGLEDYQKGSIDGIDDKPLSYIFQEDRLLPWSNVEDNIGFVLESTMDKEEKDRLIDKYIRLVELEDFRDYIPNSLSGGMKQRVAIARAFAYPSSILLMDEPFKGLDHKLKKDLMDAFLRLWSENKKTVIFVSHDLDEAKTLCHSIYHLDGRPLKVINRETGNNDL